MLAAVYGIGPWRMGRLTKFQVNYLMAMLPYVHPWSSKFGETPEDRRHPTPEELAKKYDIRVPDAYWESSRQKARKKGPAGA